MSIDLRLMLVLLAAMAACAPRLDPRDSPPSGPQEPSHVGTVQIVGSAPVNVQVVLQPGDGAAIRLTGALVSELERLQGARVAVRGPTSPAPDPLVSRQVDVQWYEIISIDGRPVVLGEIIAVEGGVARLRTEDGSEVVLPGAPASFRVGQKVWVQGPQSITVQSYGTVRP
jgi:hypothetical protein